MSSNIVSLLRDVDAYLFDAFGTTVDWFTTVNREVARRSNGAFHDQGALGWFRLHFTMDYVTVVRLGCMYRTTEERSRRSHPSISQRPTTATMTPRGDR